MLGRTGALVRFVGVRAIGACTGGRSATVMILLVDVIEYRMVWVLVLVWVLVWAVVILVLLLISAAISGRHDT